MSSEAVLLAVCYSLEIRQGSSVETFQSRTRYDWLYRSCSRINTCLTLRENISCQLLRGAKWHASKTHKENMLVFLPHPRPSSSGWGANPLQMNSSNFFSLS